MSDREIRKDFIEGVQEVFTTLFNRGDEETDGVFFYPFSPDTTSNMYGEQKFKKYQPPKLLVCKAVLSPNLPNTTVEEVKSNAIFTVTLKSLQDNDLDMTQSGLREMTKGVMKFHDTFYKINTIIPRAYVEDVFLLYDFNCSEDIYVTSVIVESGD